MPSTRRSVLGLIGAGSVGALAGCAALDAGPNRTVTVKIGGQFDDRLMVEIEVLPDAVDDGLSEDILYRSSFDVGPAGPEESFAETEAAFDSQRAVVRVLVEGLGVVEQYTFVPDCPPGATYDEVLYLTFHSPFTVSFRQNRCQ